MVMGSNHAAIGNIELSAKLTSRIGLILQPL
jgi:hypothetical protein